MSTPNFASQLASLVKPAEAPQKRTVSMDGPLSEDPVLFEFVMSVFTWEGGHTVARACLSLIAQEVVDFNELRVCLPDEIASLAEEAGHPKPQEAAVRLLASLNDVYRREHKLSLDHLEDLPKREARSYLESLEGATRFAAARTLLLAIGGHAFPADNRLLRALLEAGVPAEPSDANEAINWLERNVRAGDAEGLYLALEDWADALPKPTPKPATQASRAPAKKRPAKTSKKTASTAQKTSKKTTSKKTVSKKTASKKTAKKTVGSKATKKAAKSSGD